MPYLDDIWYVGRARAEGAHAEFWAWHMHAGSLGPVGSKMLNNDLLLSNLVRRTADASL